MRGDITDVGECEGYRFVPSLTAVYVQFPVVPVNDPKRRVSFDCSISRTVIFVVLALQGEVSLNIMEGHLEEHGQCPFSCGRIGRIERVERRCQRFAVIGLY